MATIHTITMERGTTFATTVNYINPAGNNITGSTVLFTVKAVESDLDDTDSTALILKNVTSHSDPAHGISGFTINPADTRDIEPGNYFYSCKIDVNSDDALVYELDEGRFVLSGNTTNRIAP